MSTGCVRRVFLLAPSVSLLFVDVDRCLLLLTPSASAIRFQGDNAGSGGDALPRQPAVHVSVAGPVSDQQTEGQDEDHAHRRRRRRGA